MAIDWNHQGLALLEEHERDAVERALPAPGGVDDKGKAVDAGPMARCVRGELYLIEDGDELWLRTVDGSRIVGMTGGESSHLPTEEQQLESVLLDADAAGAPESVVASLRAELDAVRRANAQLAGKLAEMDAMFDTSEPAR